MKSTASWLVLLAIAIGILLWLQPPTVEVKPLGMSPITAGDSNAGILPFEKAEKVYSHLITVRRPLDHKAYLTAFPQDAVTIAYLGDGETVARIYTNNPNPDRIKKY
jgi:hypothetical protein